MRRQLRNFNELVSLINYTCLNFVFEGVVVGMHTAYFIALAYSYV